MAVFKEGGYRYLPSVFQYSAGVAAEPGFQLVQARFKSVLPIQEAFIYIEQHLNKIGRPLNAFAHCELRSPKQFDDQGFIAFNRKYVTTLEKWGIYQAQTQEGSFINPVARTNVCPEYFGPTEVGMYSFAYTVPAGPDASASFILAGGGDAKSGPEPYRERIVAYGDTSNAGLKIKMEFVVNEMHQRLESLGFHWSDVISAQAYSVHNIGGLVEEVFAKSGRMHCGINWYFARPPVSGLEFEMDLRGSVNQIFV
ncbi:hypothetical protein [Polynucleobacter sp. AP-Melu-500A-A1]|uniref:2-amino-5-chloromuconate deaminase CnbZ n=1 Tax=Polynucleobacter sp. AP-Melu-500A-A1 TaxID=2576929 RepID=UPI0021048F3B|nr:hypothetical protein [Polynucleobacter sp. AP-Melu-500A-A1]